jgi:hypothetical protein
MRQAGTGLANTMISTLVIMRQDRWDNRRIRQIAGICVNFGGMEHPTPIRPSDLTEWYPNSFADPTPKITNWYPNSLRLGTETQALTRTVWSGS